MTGWWSRVPPAAAANRLLGATELRVLIAIGAHANSDGEAFPSLATIADLAGIDRRKVPGAISKLESSGELQRIRRGSASTKYLIRYPPKPAKVSPPQGTPPAPPEGTGVTSPGAKVSPPQGTDGVTSPGALTAQLELPNELLTLCDGEKRNLDSAFQAWNDMATETGLPTVRKLTTPLTVNLRARLAECGGIAGWQMALDRIRQAPFLLGESQSGWRATFQWTVKPANFEKIMAGNYDRSDRGRGSAVKSFLDANIEEADRNG